MEGSHGGVSGSHAVSGLLEGTEDIYYGNENKGRSDIDQAVSEDSAGPPAKYLGKAAFCSIIVMTLARIYRTFIIGQALACA